MIENIQGYLENISFMTFVFVFIGGVITSFTPCVYPLVPIVSGVIGASGSSSKIRNLFLSIAYVVGMALTFSILGVFAALTGSLFGSVQTSPLANIIVGSLIIIFALSLLGAIPMPVHLLSRMGAGKITKSRSIMPVFFMGAVSGFIAAPCATAVLGALLAFVASTQDAILGFSLLFVFSIGLGTLLILAGTFAGSVAFLSKNTSFTKIIEKLLAFFMIALGCYFIFKAGTFMY